MRPDPLLGVPTTPCRVRRMRGVHPRGAALLEVLAALAVLTIAGLSATGAVLQSVHTMEQATAGELRLRQASRFLEAVALWTAEDYDRRLGERAQGPWRLHIERAAGTLYVLTLADSAAPTRPLLRTTVHRPGTSATRAPGTTMMDTTFTGQTGADVPMPAADRR